MFRVDVERGEILESVSIDSLDIYRPREPSNSVQRRTSELYTFFKRGGPYICASTAAGYVQLLDQKDFAILKSWKAHMGWINDMDANSNFLVTCGWSPRQQYGSMLDPLAKVFDLKTLMPLPPVPFHVGAAYVRMHPRMLSAAIIAGRNGQLQVVNLVNSGMLNMRQVSLMDAYLLGLELASSGEVLALSDSHCSIQFWSPPSGSSFNSYNNPTEFADSEPIHSPAFGWTDATPLNAIGMPYYREMLFSAWPSHKIFEVGAPPARIDPQILSSLTKTEFGAHAPNPQKARRNQAVNTKAEGKGFSVFQGPKFLSEQAREGDGDTTHTRRMSDALEAANATDLVGNLRIDVPVMYRKVEIKYSKFGVDDFDFEYYNKTKFSGLETHIENSYINPLLQLMKFIPWIRNLALFHAATNCLCENCLLCELGFLFDMLEKASGLNCQATNVLRVFSSLSAASSLGVLEENSSSRPLTLMIQATVRLLLEKCAADFRQIAPHSPRMDHALTTSGMNCTRCSSCGNETLRPARTHVHELVYPPRAHLKHQMRQHWPSFSQILKGSVERQEQTRSWCDRCKRYQHMNSRKTVQSLPPVLLLNAAVHSTDAKQLWARQQWLPQEVGIIVDQGQFFCYEGQDLSIHLQRGVFPIAVYDLIGVVADINSGEDQASHLVSMINGEIKP